MDKISPERRSANMRSIRSTNTAPELVVRRFLHSLGHRYRLHANSLPGKPDIVFRRRRKVIFVHGCFWHDHAGCKMATKPKTRAEWWAAKLAANRARDQRAIDALKANDWQVLVVWECETRDVSRLTESLISFMDQPNCASSEPR